MSLIFKNGKMYGGNDVAANPTLTPSTRDLGSISIDGVTYNVGGNTGTAYKETVLWEGNESTSRWVEPIVLQNIDIGAYDQIIVQISNGQHIISANQIPFGNASGNNCIAVSGYLDNSGDNWRPIYLNRDIGNIFRVFATTGKGITLTKVVGSKTGVGGGATSADWKLLASVTGSEVVDISDCYARADEFNIVLKVDGYDDQVLTTTFPKSAIPESNGRISLGRNYCDALVKVSPASIQLYQCRGNSSEDVLSTTTMDVYYRKSGAQICFGFIDTTNVIVPMTAYPGNGSATYTATQDCVVVCDICAAANNSAYIQVDGKTVESIAYTERLTQQTYNVTLKKGQTIVIHSSYAEAAVNYAVYGIARGSEVPAYDLVRGNVYGGFIDINRVIQTIQVTTGSDWEYTATEDCWATINPWNSSNSTPTKIYLDGVNIIAVYNARPQYPLYIRKGQVLRIESRTNYTYGTIYGLSYGTQNIFAPQIYSLTEREVGTWIDNKPLYCKTIEISQYNVTLKNDVWANICTISDADYMVKAVVNTQSPNTAYLMRFQIDNGYLQGASNVQVTLTQYGQLYVTLYYTKSTDTAGSGQYNTLGMPMVHIEDNVEMVIGTYNGKPLYQMKTSFTVNTTQQINGFYRGDADLSSIMPVDIDRVLETTSNMQNPNSASRGFITSWYESDAQSLFYLCLFSTSGNTGHTTIKYTKITD